MKNKALTCALLSLLTQCGSPAFAEDPASVQMLPPTPLGSHESCPSGSQLLLSYSGTPQPGDQGGINCTPLVTDALGDLATSGYVQIGQTQTVCDGSRVGAVRWNASVNHLEVCSGN